MSTKDPAVVCPESSCTTGAGKGARVAVAISPSNIGGYTKVCPEFEVDFVWLLTVHNLRFFLTSPGTTPITILAVNSDYGLSFAGEETRTMV